MDIRSDILVSAALAPALRDSVLRRLGLPARPRTDLDGLRQLLRAWCLQVPFDNLRKMLALRDPAASPLPGGQAEDFFAAWLVDGAGGTCWAINNALHALLRAAGFDARRIVGQMRDAGVDNHASVKVVLDGRHWLADSTLLRDRPLPLDRDGFVDDHPVFPVAMDSPGDGSHRVWVDMPPNTEPMCCRILHGEVSPEYFLARYEASRTHSVFNHRLYARRDRPSEAVVLTGRTRWSKTHAGLSRRELDRPDLRRALRQDIGLSDRLITRWMRVFDDDAPDCHGFVAASVAEQAAHSAALACGAGRA
jgi:arylamine N-acetyltransferase